MRFSFLELVRQGLSGQRGWPRQWRDPEPRAAYDAVIIGGGGHGLATAYYLAKEHGIRNVAVVEKGWIGGGNTGRNTTVIRSNYLWEESERLYEHALKLWESLSDELNYNVMYSPRGVLMLAQQQERLDSVGAWDRRCCRAAGAGLDRGARPEPRPKRLVLRGPLQICEGRTVQRDLRELGEALAERLQRRWWERCLRLGMAEGEEEQGGRQHALLGR